MSLREAHEQSSITEILIKRRQHRPPATTDNTGSAGGESGESGAAKKSGAGGAGVISQTACRVYAAVRALWALWETHFCVMSEEQLQIKQQQQLKNCATSFSKWEQACNRLDELEKNNAWKDTDESPLYDYKLIRHSLQELRSARESHDIKKLLYLIRTTWTRNYGNIGNVELYRHSHTGTKRLIEQYLEECKLCLREVTRVSEYTNEINDKYILGMLIQTRKNVGRTALMLSGGGCFALFHIGVLASLLEQNLLPRIISGSSAGSIVASILCVNSNERIVELIQTIVEKEFKIFGSTDNSSSFLNNLSRFLKFGTWFDNNNLKATMIEFLGDLTFKEAYNATGRILNITVSSESIHEYPRLLNYLTSPTVLIWSAVVASCALPGIFPSITIYEKNPKTGIIQEWHHTSVKFVDGSVYNDLPIKRLSEMFNVDHIIACQVNPHVVPFLKFSLSSSVGGGNSEFISNFQLKLNSIYELIKLEINHYLEMFAELGIATNLCTKLISVISQQYSGNITILLDFDELIKINNFLNDPSPEYLLNATMKGARSTWKKISIIKNHCGIEFELDDSIKLLKSRNFQNNLFINENLPTTVINNDFKPTQATTTAPTTPKDPFKTGRKLYHTRHKSEESKFKSPKRGRIVPTAFPSSTNIRIHRSHSASSGFEHYSISNYNNSNKKYKNIDNLDGLFNN